MKTLYVASLSSALLLALSPLAHADACNGGARPGEQCIGASVTTGGADFTPFYLELDSSGNLTGMRLGPTVIPLSDLLRGKDLMIHGHKGVMSAKATGVNAATGGTLQLTYDSDIVFFGTTRSISLKISRGSSGQWVMTNNGSPVSKLVITAASRGISNISPLAMLSPSDLGSLNPATNERVGSVEDEQMVAKSMLPASNDAEKAIQAGDDGVTPSLDRAAI